MKTILAVLVLGVAACGSPTAPRMPSHVLECGHGEGDGKCNDTAQRPAGPNYEYAISW